MVDKDDEKNINDEVVNDKSTSEQETINIINNCNNLEHDCCTMAKMYSSLSSKLEKIILQNKALEKALTESRDSTTKMTDLIKARTIRQCVNSLLTIDDISSTLISMLNIADVNDKMNVLDLSIINSIKVMHHHINQTLKKFEVEIIIPEIGSIFNPEYHMAISTVSSCENHANNTIVKILHTGCILDGKIIRPAAVIVAI